MRWGDVVDAMVAEILASTTMQAALDVDPGDTEVGRFGYAEERTFERDDFPWLDYEVVSDEERWEVFEGVLVRFTTIARDLDDVVTIEAELRRLFNHKVPVTIQGVRMWAEWIIGAPLLGADDGIRGRQSDFRFTPVRAVYES